MHQLPYRLRGRLLPAACLITAALAAGPLTAGASAQATRTWLSGTGDDANPCSRTAPCKTIAGAISKTAAGGEINAVDPGGFGAVTLNKAVTIDFSTIGTGGILNTSVNGVLVNAAPTDDVTLRGLDVFGAAASSGSCRYAGLAGIRVLGGRTIRIEDSTIASQATGIQLVPTASDLTVLVNRVDISNTCNYGIQVAPAAGHTVGLTVRDSTFLNTGTAISAGVGAGVALAGSTITGNTTGLQTSGDGTITAFGANQVFGNDTDGVPTSVRSDGLTGPQGAPGAAGPAGPAGAPGATGATGAPAYRLLVVLPKKKVSVAAGQGLALDYVSTSAAQATLTVKKGRKVVAAVKKKAKLGANTIVWNGKAGRKAAAAGTYKLTVTTAGADGQTGSATATLKITKTR